MRTKLSLAVCLLVAPSCQDAPATTTTTSTLTTASATAAPVASSAPTATTSAAAVAAAVPTAIDSAGPAVNVRFAAIEGEAIDEPLARKMLEAETGKLGACYQAELRKNAKLGGRMAIDVELDAAGKPTTVTKHATDIASDELTACVVRAFETITWPKPTKAPAKVTAHFVLLPA